MNKKRIQKTILSTLILMNTIGVVAFASPKVFIDAGHMGRGMDPGSIAYNGTLESDMTLELSDLIDKELQALGVEVIRNRVDEANVTPGQTVRMANSIKDLDYFLSVHFNASINPKATGVETFYNLGTYDKDGKLISKEICETMEETLGLPFRRNEVTPYYNRKVNTKGTLIEGGFITNSTDFKAYQDNKEKLAKNIAKVIYENIGEDTDELYRVKDANGKQIGAFKNLDNARKMNGTEIYNNKGERVY